VIGAEAAQADGVRQSVTRHRCYRTTGVRDAVDLVQVRDRQ